MIQRFQMVVLFSIGFTYILRSRPYGVLVKALIARYRNTSHVRSLTHKVLSLTKYCFSVSFWSNSLRFISDFSITSSQTIQWNHLLTLTTEIYKCINLYKLIINHWSITVTSTWTISALKHLLLSHYTII